MIKVIAILELKIQELNAANKWFGSQLSRKRLPYKDSTLKYTNKFKRDYRKYIKDNRLLVSDLKTAIKLIDPTY